MNISGVEVLPARVCEGNAEHSSVRLVFPQPALNNDSPVLELSRLKKQPVKNSAVTAAECGFTPGPV